MNSAPLIDSAMLRFIAIAAFIWLSGCAANSPSRPDPDAHFSQTLPKAAVHALAVHASAILYSLEPWAPRVNGDQGLYGFQILGKIELTQQQAGIAAAEFRSAVTDWNGVAAACFDPRHALSVTYAKHKYDFLLCYRCQNIEVFEDGKPLGWYRATGSPKQLNALLTSGHVPLSTSDSDEDRAAREELQERNRARWLAAMPSAIRPLWTSEMFVNTFISNTFTSTAGAALTARVPDSREQILSLLQWYGSGAGPWSGFPAYEKAAEELLLTYPTPEVITALGVPNLSDAEIEGAARFFSGWNFNKQRPTDRSLITPELRELLLRHSVQSADTDKVQRATNAFGK